MGVPMGADGARPGSLRQQRGFVLYSSGVVLSEIGDKGTFTANLFHVYALTGSVAQTGLIGLARAVALLVLSPLGGAYADRLDRRRLLQYSQAASLAAVLALTVTTVTGTVRPWHVMLSVLLNSADVRPPRAARARVVARRTRPARQGLRHHRPAARAGLPGRSRARRRAHPGGRAGADVRRRRGELHRPDRHPALHPHRPGRGHGSHAPDRLGHR